MIEEGATAPGFELPGIRGGEVGQIDTKTVFGSGIVLLAFYPGDFNPAYSETETDLDELNLFTMQKDVTVLAISGDSVHSHQAFAGEYNLEMTLLSDLRGEVAREYGVGVDDTDAGHLTRRAVFVVDHTETVQYAWMTDDCEELPDVDAIRDVIQGIGDDDAARSRYRVGHARYMEGRRTFTSAVNAYEDREWMMAQTDFTRAAEEFDEASEEFNTAVRFSEDETARRYFERAEEKSEALWRASEWLGESAGAFASGAGREADSLRSDAEGPLETVRELHEPPDPDDFPPEEDPAERETDEDEDCAWLDDGEDIDTSLDADIGEEEELSEEEAQAQADAAEPADATAASEPAADAAAAPTADTADAGGDEGEDEEGAAIDDEELEEITAELEMQSEAAEDAEESEPEPGGGNVVPRELDTGDDDGTDEVAVDSDMEAGEGVSEVGAAEAEAGPTAGEASDTAAVDEAAVDGPAEGPAEHDADSPGGAEAEDDDAADDVDTDEDGNIKLNLTDPTEGEDDEEEEDDEEPDPFGEDSLDGGGDHGVPDSL